jgi:NAD(P)-dependent dehydrogenase (short-subunit alcohol dehydrogenase family)
VEALALATDAISRENAVVVTFLVSPDASDVTGSVLAADGGWL